MRYQQGMRTKRQKQVVTLTLDPELVERLKAWIAKQELSPPQNAVVARAITKFLDEDEGKSRKSPVQKTQSDF